MSSATLDSARGRIPRWVYPALVLLLIVMVVGGFWPSYYGRLLRSGVARPWWIHIHAAIFTGWMALLGLQSWLVATGRTRVHRRVGRVGAVYGVVVLAAGLAVTFAAAALNVRTGRMTLDGAAEALLYPLLDIGLFAGFFAAAIAWRRKPDIHKRLMLAATVSLAYAALSRPLSIETPLFLAVWLSPLVGAMAADFAARRSTHPALLGSVLILGVSWARVYISGTPGWLRVGRALLAPFL